MATKRPRRPRDANQLAKLIVDMATGAVPSDPEPKPETKLTKARRKGGLKGGKARAKRLTAKDRTRIARRAAVVRWNANRLGER
jgi:hypothetical protein